MQEKQDLHVKRENSRCTNTLSGSFFTNCSAAYLQSAALRKWKTCIKLCACRNTLVKQPISNRPNNDHLYEKSNLWLMIGEIRKTKNGEHVPQNYLGWTKARLSASMNQSYIGKEDITDRDIWCMSKSSSRPAVLYCLTTHL